MSYTLDTNAIIYHLKGDTKATVVVLDIFSRNLPVYISTVTEVELLSYPNLTNTDARLINEFLAAVSITPLDSRIARLAAAVRRSSRLRVPDGVIAATALFTRSILITRNFRDFKNVPGLRVEVV